MKDILNEITRLRLERNWSESQLAERSGLERSLISAWYREGQLPDIESLDKLCTGFGITLSQFFAEDDDIVSLTPMQKETLKHWAALTETQKETLLNLLKSLG